VEHGNRMDLLAPIVLRGVRGKLRTKALFLSAWFFVTVATLWILKPVRVASLLVHLGAAETPYVRLAGVVTLAFVVAGYSVLVRHMSRIGVVRATSLVYAGLLAVFWGALAFGGANVGSQRAFVWGVYILVEIHAVTMVGLFWTYTNDVCDSEEANRIYGFVGLGGTVGGIAGGAFVDVFARPLGAANLLLVCAGLVLVGLALASRAEVVLRPPQRERTAQPEGPALAGAREVLRSPYLALLVGIVVAYEFTATLTDFGTNVIFEQAYPEQIELARMYGRLGWIVSGTAVVGQVVLVPLLLPIKRVSLLLPPFAMLLGVLGALSLPVVAMAVVLAAADRGLNYSIHQATKESMYVPLTDAQKYEAKAFVDMFVDRAAKAAAAFVLIGLIRTNGASARPALAVSLVSIVVWAWAGRRLAAFWRDGKGPRP
jgi:AAA family ATP:ADP antiporter